MKTKVRQKKQESEYRRLIHNKNFRNSRHYLYDRKNLQKIYRFYAFQIVILNKKRFYIPFF